LENKVVEAAALTIYIIKWWSFIS